MKEFNLLKIVDRIFVLKPEEQKIINKWIEEIKQREEAKNDKN
jgi:hypothetical protein